MSPAKSQELRIELGIPERAPVLLFVGRVSGEKGIDLLPEVLDGVRAQHPQTILVVAGPDDARDPPQRNTAVRLADDAAIRRLGYVADPSALYALSDVFVFPSYFEGFGNVLLEAAAHERIAVGFDVPGVQEAIADQVSGFLVPEGDTVAMIEAINRVLSSPDKKREMQIAARQRVVEEFSNDAIWTGLEKMFRELVSTD